MLAELREKQGDAAGALEALGRARKKDPAARGPWRARATCSPRRSGWTKPRRCSTSLLESGFDADAAAELAFVRFRQEKPEQARALLDKALKRAPGLYKAHYYLGAVLFRQGDVQGAERAYREADAPHPHRLPRPRRPLRAAGPERGRGGGGADAPAAPLRFPRDGRTLAARCVP